MEYDYMKDYHNNYGWNIKIKNEMIGNIIDKKFSVIKKIRKDIEELVYQERYHNKINKKKVKSVEMKDKNNSILQNSDSIRKTHVLNNSLLRNKSNFEKKETFENRNSLETGKILENAKNFLKKQKTKKSNANQSRYTRNVSLDFSETTKIPSEASRTLTKIFNVGRLSKINLNQKQNQRVSMIMDMNKKASSKLIQKLEYSIKKPYKNTKALNNFIQEITKCIDNSSKDKKSLQKISNHNHYKQLQEELDKDDNQYLNIVKSENNIFMYDDKGIGRFYDKEKVDSKKKKKIFDAYSKVSPQYAYDQRKVLIKQFNLDYSNDDDFIFANEGQIDQKGQDNNDENYKKLENFQNHYKVKQLVEDIGKAKELLLKKMQIKKEKEIIEKIEKDQKKLPLMEFDKIGRTEYKKKNHRKTLSLPNINNLKY